MIMDRPTPPPTPKPICLSPHLKNSKYSPTRKPAFTYSLIRIVLGLRQSSLAFTDARIARARLRVRESREAAKEHSPRRKPWVQGHEG